MGYTLPNGGDVRVSTKDSMLNYERIEFTDSGMVVCINKRGYQIDCYPREVIEGIHTHTNHLEDKEWW